MADAPGLTPGWLITEVARLAGAGFDDGERIALAVSGGVDSLALLSLAAGGFGRRAHVLTVDHGLRAEAVAECAMVADLANGLGLAADMLPLSLGGGGNVQARARDARYRALGARCRALGIRWLLTAHHQDDQAETLLLRLARGSGLAGLSAIGRCTGLAGVIVLRPLLAASRASLAAIVAGAGWTAVDDPSNADPRYDRSRARALLRATPWLAPARLAASASHLQQAEEALCWAAERAFAGRASRDERGRLALDPEGLPAELRRRLLAQGLAAVAAAPSGPALSRLLARLEAGGAGSCGPALARACDGRWLVGAAPARRLADKRGNATLPLETTGRMPDMERQPDQLQQTPSAGQGE